MSRRARKARIVVELADGTQYEIHPRADRKGKPQHRVYRRVPRGRTVGLAVKGKRPGTVAVGGVTLERVTSDAELQLVADRFAEMANDARGRRRRRELVRAAVRPFVVAWAWARGLFTRTPEE